MTHLLYNIRSNRDEDHVRSDVLTSIDMKYKANLLGDVMRSGGREHVSCSALLFALWSSALTLEKRVVQASTKIDPEESKSESEKRKNVEMQAVFEID